MKSKRTTLHGFLALAALLACGGSQVEPKRSHNRTELAKDFLSKQQLEAAEREAQRAIELDESNADAYNVLGMVELLRSISNHRLLEVDDCLTGVDAEGLRSEFDAHLERAAEHFDRATALDPEYSEAHQGRGLVALHLEDFTQAETSLNRALAVPHRLQSLSLTRANLGWIYFHQDKHAEAAKELRQALQFTPNLCVANYRLGRVYFAREEWDKALEKFQVVVSDNSCPMQEAHLYSVKTLTQLGRIDESDQGVEACAALAPKSCIAAQCRTGM